MDLYDFVITLIFLENNTDIVLRIVTNREQIYFHMHIEKRWKKNKRKVQHDNVIYELHRV